MKSAERASSSKFLPKLSEFTSRIVFDTRIGVEDHCRPRLAIVGRPMRNGGMVRVAGSGEGGPRCGHLVGECTRRGTGTGQNAAGVVEHQADIDAVHRAKLSTEARRRPGKQVRIRRSLSERGFAFRLLGGTGAK